MLIIKRRRVVESFECEWGNHPAETILLVRGVGNAVTCKEHVEDSEDVLREIAAELDIV